MSISAATARADSTATIHGELDPMRQLRTQPPSSMAWEDRREPATGYWLLPQDSVSASAVTKEDVYWNKFAKDVEGGPPEEQ